MLLSAIISLTPVTSAPIFGTLGRPAQAWFLNQILYRRSHLAKSLHDEEGSKPFTVSTLLNRYGHPYKAGDWLEEGQECWLRVTTIGEELSKLSLSHVLKKLPKTLTLYKMDFRIDGYTLNPHEHAWAGETTFAEIAQDRGIKTPHGMSVWNSSRPLHFEITTTILPYRSQARYFAVSGRNGTPFALSRCRWMTAGPRLLKIASSSVN